MVISENKKAIIWSGIDKISTYVVNFILQIILARLLVPDDYTVVAMLAIFFALAQAFIDSGFATTLIQKKNCTQNDYSSVFFFNILISCIIYVILFFCAPFIENFYKFPNLCKVTRIYSITLVISSFFMVSRVILTKELKFKTIATIGLISSLISGTFAIYLAYNKWGYWSLVAQSILSSLISVILFFIFSKWKPNLLLSFSSIKSLSPFGIRILLIYIFHAIYNNIYSLLIGKNFAPQDLGYYDRGKTLASTGAVGFSDFFSRALYPIQSKMQDDLISIEKIYNRAFNLAATLIGPFSIFLSIFSSQIVYVLYGEKWMFSSWIVSILALGFLFYPLQALNMNVVKSLGRADLLLKSEILKKTLGITIIIITIHFGLRIVIFGWTLYAILEFIISEAFTFKCCKFKLNFQIKTFIRSIIFPLSLALVLFIITNMILNLNIYLQLIISILLYYILYFLFFKKMIKQLLSFSS